MISVVIPTFDRKLLVGRAIESVLTQRVPADEIIVVDDGSTDGTAEMIRARYGSRVRLLQQSNGGVSAARALGLKAATGDWVAFLDSDDVWKEQTIACQRAHLQHIPKDVVWLFGNAELDRGSGPCADLFSSYGLPVGDLCIFDTPLEIIYPMMFCLMPASVVRRRALTAVQAFSQGLRASEDFLLAVQCATLGRFAATKDVFCVVNRSDEQKTHSLERSARSGVDFYRARVLAFDYLLNCYASNQFAENYRRSVRSMCMAMDLKGEGEVFATSIKQFKHGFSFKAALFTLCTGVGSHGIQAWKRLQHLRAKPAHVSNDPFGFFH